MVDERSLLVPPLIPVERQAGNDYSEAFRESAAGIRKLIARKLRGEEVCSEKLEEHERQIVCTPEGVFKWADPDFKPGPGCGRCAGHLNSCANGGLGVPTVAAIDVLAANDSDVDNPRSDLFKPARQ